MTHYPPAGEATDFSLDNTTGQQIKLSDYRNKKNVVLVFNRGFT